MLRTGAFTNAPVAKPVAAPVVAAVVAPTTPNASELCCAQVHALCSDVVTPCHESPAVSTIRSLATFLGTQPMTDAIGADFTRLSVVARSARMHGGVIHTEHLKSLLQDLENRHSH